MGTNKKIALIVSVVVVIAGIWYLESLKVHPAAPGGNAQTIAVPTSSSTSTGVGLTSAEAGSIAQLAAADAAAGYHQAIEIANPTGFVNVAPGFTLSSVIGKKVVLLDFWTYSCINCVRTIPYLNAWYQKYQNDGLEIVGIHTPEFDFEKQLSNVQSAVQEYGIHYPVILDSNYGTWNAYDNLYWPHEYLIDMAGYIVHDQVGEGSYGETETEIQKLLTERAQILGTDPNAIPTSTLGMQAPNLNDILSPETYFGAARNSLLANGTFFVNGEQKLVAPSADAIAGNKLYLGGTWNFADQYAQNVTASATILYKYDAANVYIVAAGAANGTVIDVLQDGVPIGAADAGSDVHNGKLTVSGNKLYNLVKNSNGGGMHTLQLMVESPGLQAFTFTFG
jgi:thiol-disulfide isomerase/thioredoxin